MTNYKVKELNSTFVHGELYRKFLQFRENEKALVLEGVDNVIDEKPQELKAYIWVLIEDNELFPKFETVFSDGLYSAEDTAIQKYGVDIIDLYPPYFKLKKTVRIFIDEHEIKIIGTFAEIENKVLATFASPVTSLQIIKNIEQFFSELQSVHSFMVDVPATKKYVVMEML